MSRKEITRRDFINGVLVGASGVIGAGTLIRHGDDLIRVAAAAEAEAAPLPEGLPYYPPAWTGMRGSHDGAFERAHELAREGRTDWGGVADTGEEYDLVIVGAGASGLGAAYFFQQKHDGKAKVLILDNHDDFGGHARRNEFESGGIKRMTYAGSQAFDNIDGWPQEMWTMLDELGIDIDRFQTLYDRDWYTRHGLKGGVYLDAATWGRDHWIPADLGDLGPVMPGLGGGGGDFAALFADAPIPDAAKAELIALYGENGASRVLAKLDDDDPDYDKLPYETFLKTYWGIKQAETFAFLRKLPTDENGVGADALSLSEGIGAGMPGTVTLGKRSGLKKEADPGDPGYIHHFPDGNAGFCRMVVRALTPEVAAGETMDDVVLADFDYAALDVADNATRIRLSSTAIEVKHEGDPATAEKVAVTYIFDGKPHRVRGKKVILACWNMIIPHICRDLPEPQKEALSSNVKIPYVFANVMIKNWRAIKESGIGASYNPTSFFHLFQSEYPVNQGGYTVADDPDKPMAITLIRVPIPEERDMEPREQFRMGRYEILAMSFEDFETQVHDQLNGMFGAYGFDAKRDIEALTLNRWSHGYAYTYFTLWDNGATIDDGPHIKARARFGRIAIANSDSGADSWLDIGVMQGLRAVRELDVV